MIVGHRTKPDSYRTVVFKVAFPCSSEHMVDTFEMERAEVEAAIHKHMCFEKCCTQTVLEWDSDPEDTE